MTTSEEPFSTPQAAVVDAPALPAEIAPEKHYRPTKRSSARIRSISSFALTVGTLALVNLRFNELAFFSASLVVIIVLLSMRHRLRSPKWVKRNDAAVSRLGSGEIELGAIELENLCHEVRGTPLLHALCIFNRGVAYIQQGDHRRALQLFSAVLDSGWTQAPQIPNFQGMVTAEAALALGLLGELDRAEIFRRKAQQHLEFGLGRLVFVDVVLAVRKNDPKTAAAIARSQFRQAEAQRGGHGVRALRSVWAFALSTMTVDGERRREIQRLIDGAYPFEVGELDYLATHWPELKKFLVECGLSQSMV